MVIGRRRRADAKDSLRPLLDGAGPDVRALCARLLLRRARTVRRLGRCLSPGCRAYKAATLGGVRATASAWARSDAIRAAPCPSISDRPAWRMARRAPGLFNSHCTVLATSLSLAL